MLCKLLFFLVIWHVCFILCAFLPPKRNQNVREVKSIFGNTQYHDVDQFTLCEDWHESNKAEHQRFWGMSVGIGVQDATNILLVFKHIVWLFFHGHISEMRLNTAKIGVNNVCLSELPIWLKAQRKHRPKTVDIMHLSLPVLCSKS